MNDTTVRQEKGGGWFWPGLAGVLFVSNLVLLYQRQSTVATIDGNAARYVELVERYRSADAARRGLVEVLSKRQLAEPLAIGNGSSSEGRAGLFYSVKVSCPACGLNSAALNELAIEFPGFGAWGLA